MPLEKDNILEFKQCMKSDKMPCIIYADIESFIRKIDECANNPVNSLITKIVDHIPTKYSMSRIRGFDHIEDKHTLYHGKDCVKKRCTTLREHAKNIIDFQKKKVPPVTKEELKSHKDAKVCYIRGERTLKKLSKSLNYRKVRDYCHYTGKYRGAAHHASNLNFNVPNEISVVFHNVLNCDYHFIINELANEFEGQFECVVEKKENFKPFSVLMINEITKINEDGNESVVNISYNIK